MADHDRVDVDAVDALVARVTADPRTHKRHREKVGSRKTRSPLRLTDCFTAPCEHGGCPIEQQVPTYLALAADGRSTDAFRVIARDNTAPTITGVLCSEPCRQHCTRLDYDAGVDIRGREAGGRRCRPGRLRREHHAGTPVDGGARRRHRGRARRASPRRCSCAATESAVDVYEKLDGPYGIVRRIIPTFRITREQVDRDYRLAVATGVDFHFGCDPDYDLADLRRRFDHVVRGHRGLGSGCQPRRQRRRARP